MEPSTIMGDLPPPPRARATDKLSSIVAGVASPHRRFVEGLRLLPRNPPPHAVTLAVVTAAVLGAATGVVLAISRPATENASAQPAAMTASSLRKSRPVLVRTGPPPIPVNQRGPGSISGDSAGEPEPPGASATATVVAPSGSPSAPRVAAPGGPPVNGAETDVTAANAGPRPRTIPVAGNRPVGRAGASSVAATLPAARITKPAEGTGEERALAEELIWLAERAFQSGHPAEAVRLGQKALAAHGGARAHLALAAAYFDLRRFDDARASYESVLQAEPGNQAARIGVDLAKTAQAQPPELQP